MAKTIDLCRHDLEALELVNIELTKKPRAPIWNTNAVKEDKTNTDTNVSPERDAMKIINRPKCRNSAGYKKVLIIASLVLLLPIWSSITMAQINSEALVLAAKSGDL